MMTTMNEEKKNRTEHEEKESGRKSEVDKERRDKCERYVCLRVQKRKMLSFRWWRSGAGARTIEQKEIFLGFMIVLCIL